MTLLRKARALLMTPETPGATAPQPAGRPSVPSREQWRMRDATSTGFPRYHAARSMDAVSSSDCGTTRAFPRTDMKFVSPTHRGTM